MVCFLAQTLQVLSVWYANLANINPGAVTVISGITPLTIAICDYWFFNYTLSYHDLIGMIGMIVSSVLLAVYSIIYDDKDILMTEKKQVVGSWVAVVIALTLPPIFTARLMVFRKL